MPSSGMLGCVALVRTNFSEESSAFIIRVTRIGELGTLAVTSNLCNAAKKYYDIVFLLSMHRLLVTANVVPSSPRNTMS
jgi:hypothetical protein